MLKKNSYGVWNFRTKSWVELPGLTHSQACTLWTDHENTRPELWRKPNREIHMQLQRLEKGRWVDVPGKREDWTLYPVQMHAARILLIEAENVKHSPEQVHRVKRCIVWVPVNPA